MSIDEIESYYSENYNVIFDYSQVFEENNYYIYNCETDEKQKWLHIKDAKSKCRFCGQEKPVAAFKKVAHTIPELLGNKRIISIENECDACNSLFSNYERDLTTFLLPYLITNGIKGKHGTRKYKTLDGKSSITFKDDLIQVCEEQGFSRISEDEEKHEMEYKYYCDGYVKNNIYKILAKIALALLPEEVFKNFHFTSSSLISSARPSGLEKIRFTVYKGLGVFGLNVRGYLRKTDNIFKPSYIFYLCCGNFTFQVPLFSDADIKKFKPEESFQLEFYELDDLKQKMNGEKPSSIIIDCTNTELIEKGFKTILLHYDEKREVL